jgi:hypothetical protein
LQFAPATWGFPKTNRIHMATAAPASVWAPTLVLSHMPYGKRLKLECFEFAITVWHLHGLERRFTVGHSWYPPPAEFCT